MPHYAILDTNAGLLQWIGEAPNESNAYFQFAQDINEDVDDIVESSEYFELTAEEAKTVKAWWDNGASAVEAPECINPRRR